ncbi:gamma-glutamyltransferase family protein [Planomonospora algeriensis]
MITHRSAVPLAVILVAGSTVLTRPASASPPQTPQPVAPATAPTTSPATGRPGGEQAGKAPVAEGYGGAVSTVDPDASRAALRILKRGGNAVDAAVAAAAVLGVTEPYSAGLAGGGFLLHYDARRGKVHTIDGRETAPKAMTATSLEGVPFEEAVTSGLSAGVPGSVAQWELALRRFGTLSLRQALQPAVEVADRGFTVDQTFHDQTAANAARFADFTSTAKLFLPGGAPPRVGSTFRNPELAETYRTLGRKGPRWLYGGRLGEEVVATVKRPPVTPGSTRNVRPGLMELPDLRAYRALERPPTKVVYKGMDVYGMAPPSSGGSTVGEALNILEALPEAGPHEYLEASRLAFADRGRYVGDVPGVPLAELLSDGFAKERACLVTERAMAHPAPAGEPDGTYGPCPAASPTAPETGTAAPETGTAAPEGPETTHLVVADRWGNVVAYNITIESTGGNGIVVPAGVSCSTTS